MSIYCRSSLICLLLIAIPATVCAAFRIRDADAVITIRGGIPCFSYPRDEEIQKRPYLFGGLSVSKAGSQGGVLWEIGIASQDRKGILEPNSPETCIEYGVSRQGTKVINLAKPLLDETPYYVLLRVSTPAEGTYYVRRYLSYFCLSHNEKGEPILGGAEYNDKTDSWSCLRPDQSPKRSFWQKLFGK